MSEDSESDVITHIRPSLEESRLKAELISMTTRILSALQFNIYWLSWNLYLAFVPLALSILLFRGGQPRSWSWWLIFLMFLAFLPNAPYLLTDTIHLIDLLHMTNSMWIIILILIPVYLLFILAGFEAYVLSLINQGYYLNRMGWGRWIIWAELLTHALCAVGIYLGRFLRFNSWDFINRPHALAFSIIGVLGSKRRLLIIAVSFVVVSGLYWIMKQASLRIIAQMRSLQVATTRQ